MERCVEIDHYHKKEKKKRAIPIYWLGMGLVYVKDGIFSTFTILWYFFFLICPSAGNLLKYVLCIIIFDQYAFFFKNVYLVSRNCECVHAQFLQSCLTFCNPMDCSPPGSSVLVGIIQYSYTGVGCHFLLQRIFVIQGLSPHLLNLLNCRQILYC